MSEQLPDGPTDLVTGNTTLNPYWETATHELSWIGDRRMLNTDPNPVRTFSVSCPHCGFDSRFVSAINLNGAVCFACGRDVTREYNEARAGDIQRPGTPATPPLPPPPQPQVEQLMDLSMRTIPNDVRDALIRIERWANRMTAGHWVLGGIEKRRPVRGFARTTFGSEAIDRPMMVDPDIFTSDHLWRENDARLNQTEPDPRHLPQMTELQAARQREIARLAMERAGTEPTEGPERRYWTEAEVEAMGIPSPMVPQPSEPEVGPDHERPF